MAKVVSQIVGIPRWWVSPVFVAAKALLFIVAPFASDATVDRIIGRSANLIGNHGLRFEVR